MVLLHGIGNCSALLNYNVSYKVDWMKIFLFVINVVASHRFVL